MAGIIANNFGSLSVVFKSGNGAELTAEDGKKYIDFVSGIGVNCLGHNHPALVAAITEQAQKQIHISNYYNSDVGLAFAREITKAAGMDCVYFCNSGAEANEAAIKLARKYGWLSDQQEKNKAVPRKTIVTLEKSFHGRSLATLRATGQEKFHADSFAPYPDGFKHIKPGDYEALKTVFDSSVCGFLMECVQGEGGVNLIDAEWAKAACEAARNAGALVMIDEVQTGMGRTGTLFASAAMDLHPDVITCAKGIAGGVPMGACIYGGKATDVFVAGDHQSTFGGNPLACACGRAVLKELQSPGFLDNVNAAGEFIRETIKSWNLPCVTEVRGKGLMIGIDVTMVPGEVQKKCLANGLCVSTAGTKTVRFLPPLILDKVTAEKGLAIFKDVLLSF
ncbi:MAG: acetylornithine/succinylornithine family transaminase [Treponemataceae bacterium]|nr:acetylornithine/succinylornithine family transaminase [Treponemataceae bacterium]